MAVVEFAPDLPAAPSPEAARDAVAFSGNASTFTLTLPGPRRLAILCESAKPLTARLSDNGQELRFTTVSTRSGQTGLSIGRGAWAFLMADLSSGRHQIELDAAGATSVSAYVLAEAPISSPPIPAQAPRSRRVTHLFTQNRDSTLNTPFRQAGKTATIQLCLGGGENRAPGCAVRP